MDVVHCHRPFVFQLCKWSTCQARAIPDKKETLTRMISAELVQIHRAYADYSSRRIKSRELPGKLPAAVSDNGGPPDPIPTVGKQLRQLFLKQHPDDFNYAGFIGSEGKRANDDSRVE
jgi:hypothetical protein